MITIVDYGMGNPGSIKNMLKRIGHDSVISGTAVDLERASKLIIPGVGAFNAAMRELNALGILPLLNDLVQVRKLPTLGICLGMQIMTDGSDEGNVAGLGWVKGHARHFSDRLEKSFKVPHMGWNVVTPCKSSRLLEELNDEMRFYFVHSYHVVLDNHSDRLLTAHYGFDFDAAFEIDNIIGVQFHPEKSQRFGFQLLSNFAAIN